MSTMYLISAAPGDLVPGRELADPECPEVPGLLDRPEIAAWLAQVGYGPDAPDELVYLLAEGDAGAVPAGFEYLAVSV
ncbi:hypothetical protein [Streptomyces sp. NPDC048057]|uniref:hypothetical protein n=1 Tax=Streptomyces sp. NPDC048057 TaxID=3155628 RepID=UPI0033CB22F6